MKNQDQFTIHGITILKTAYFRDFSISTKKLANRNKIKTLCQSYRAPWGRFSDDTPPDC